MKFDVYTLDEIAKIKYGKNQKAVVSSNGKIPIYGTGGLMGYADKFLYNKPSVLIGRKGTIDKVRYVTHPFWTVDTLFYTEVNDEIVIPHFLYYLLSLIDLKKYNEGTTIPSLRTETLYTLEFKIPPLEVQHKILSVLEPLENKIELNNKINENLEQQISSIFDDWFIECIYTNSGIPEQWSKATLGDIATITSGKRPPMKQATISKDVATPLIGASSIMGYTNAVLYDEQILVTGRVGTHGIVQRFSSPCWPSDNTLVVKSQYYEFVNQILCRIDYRNMNRGSTQPLITQTDLKNVEINLPPLETLNKFELLAGKIMSLHEENRIENVRLAEIRDSLLPKLISGEIDIFSV